MVALGAWYGRDYYRLPLAARPHHPLHWELKPGGTLGHLYGVGGAALMLAMLSYTVRRRVGALRELGRLGHWLDFHIWCGVTGPLLIVFHSALKVNGLIAISFWSMVAVALSGAVGRFLYAQIPRSAAGDELSLEEAARLERDLTARLSEQHGLTDDEMAAIEALSGAVSPGRDESEGSLLRLWLFAPLDERRRLAALRASARGRLPRAAVDRLAALVRQRAQLRRRLRAWRRLHELFHYWHVFHKPFAILMYLFAAVHVGVAWMTGYALGGA